MAGPVPATGVTLFLLGGAALAGRRIPRTARFVLPAPDTTRHPAVASRTSSAWTVIFLVGIQTMVRGGLNTVAVAFVVDALAAADGVVGVLLAAIGVGGLVGLPIALAAVGRRRVYRVLGAGLVLWGVPLAVSAPTQNVPVVVALFGIVGIGNALVDVAHVSALSRGVPPERLGSVFGLLEGTVQVGMAGGAAAGGLLLAHMPPEAVLYLLGLAPPLAATGFARSLIRSDRRLGRLDDEIELLRGQRMFRSLPIATLDTLAQRMGRAGFGPGEMILSEGELGSDYLIITGGTVLICVDDHVINVVHRGSAIGEIALIRNTPRTASAVAATPVSARTIDRDTFLTAIGQDPAAWSAAESVVSGRLASTPRYR
ncbi:cyclic nucleotide-binding domain-containing protein [Actinomycetes bacterium KLBMP 9759]